MLWILQRYVTRELLKLFAVALLVIILLVFFGFSLKAMYAGFDLFHIYKIVPYIFLQAFPYSLPFALLIAVIKSSATFVHELCYARKGRIEQEGDSIHLYLYDGDVAKYSYTKAREMKRFRFGQLHIAIPTGGDRVTPADAGSLSLTQLDNLSLRRLVKSQRELDRNITRSGERFDDPERVMEELAAKNELMLADIENGVAELRYRVTAARELRTELQNQVDKNNEVVRTISRERDQTESRRKHAEDQEKSHRIAIVIHRMLSFSFASFAFAVVGVPLGILSRHGHFIVGLGLGIALVLIYYCMIFTGTLFAAWRYLPVAPAMWWADLTLLAVGAALLWRLMKR